MALLEAVPEPISPGWVRPLRREGAGNEPLVAASRWETLPKWIALWAERGGGGCRDRGRLRCFYGCRKGMAPMNARRSSHGCFKCGESHLPRGAPMLRCRCGWGVCGSCAAQGPRLPALGDDPLFLAPHHAALLGAPGATDLGSASASFGSRAGRGTVIVCPGGNYEFLCPNEGLPVAAWLVQHGINACVLKYRLLPRHDHEAAVDDLWEAARCVRARRGGPVAALGFSAGGHLITSLAAREAAEGGGRGAGEGPAAEHALDAQVLVYPGLDGRDWLEPDSCGFFDIEPCIARAPTLLARQTALLGGRGFAAAPTLLVASTGDEMCPPEGHCDPYAEALSRHGIAHRYLREDFGPHGFGLDGGWTDACIEWLRGRGFGCGGSPDPGSCEGRVGASGADGSARGSSSGLADEA